MKKILVWTVILFGLIIYMKFSNQTPNDLIARTGQTGGASQTTGKTFGMILPPEAKAQLRS